MGVRALHVRASALFASCVFLQSVGMLCKPIAPPSSRAPRLAGLLRLRGGGRVHKSENRLEGEGHEPALRGSGAEDDHTRVGVVSGKDGIAGAGDDVLTAEKSPFGGGRQRLGFSRGDGLAGGIDDSEDMALGVGAESKDDSHGGGGASRRSEVGLGDGGPNLLGGAQPAEQEGAVGAADGESEGHAGSSGMRVIGLDEEQRLEFLRRIPGMKLDQLKTQLRLRGLSDKGKKNDLAARLRESITDGSSPVCPALLPKPGDVIGRAGITATRGDDVQGSPHIARGIDRAAVKCGRIADLSAPVYIPSTPPPPESYTATIQNAGGNEPDGRTVAGRTVGTKPRQSEGAGEAGSVDKPGQTGMPRGWQTFAEVESARGDWSWQAGDPCAAAGQGWAAASSGEERWGEGARYGRREVTCFRCGVVGHVAAQCTEMVPGVGGMEGSHEGERRAHGGRASEFRGRGGIRRGGYGREGNFRGREQPWRGGRDVGQGGGWQQQQAYGTRGGDVGNGREEIPAYEDLSGESSEEGYKGHIDALDDVLPVGIDPPGSQVSDFYRDVGGKTLREAMQCPHGKYRMECINLSSRRAARERAAGTLKIPECVKGVFPGAGDNAGELLFPDLYSDAELLSVGYTADQLAELRLPPEVAIYTPTRKVWLLLIEAGSFGDAALNLTLTRTDRASSRAHCPGTSNHRTHTRAVFPRARCARRGHLQRHRQNERGRRRLLHP